MIFKAAKRDLIIFCVLIVLIGIFAVSQISRFLEKKQTQRDVLFAQTFIVDLQSRLPKAKWSFSHPLADKPKNVPYTITIHAEFDGQNNLKQIAKNVASFESEIKQKYNVTKIEYHEELPSYQMTKAKDGQYEKKFLKVKQVMFFCNQK